MTRYDSSNIRNVAILGHQGSGKTSLVEALYYVTGGTSTKGDVTKKTSVSDYLALSISLVMMTLLVKHLVLPKLLKAQF